MIRSTGSQTFSTCACAPGNSVPGDRDGVLGLR